MDQQEVKCPSCGRDMEFGYLKSSQPMFWTKEKKNRWFISKYQNFIMLGPRLLIRAPRLEAYNCLHCGILLCDYDNQ